MEIDELKEKLIEDYYNGCSIRELSEKYSLSRPLISRHFKKWGVMLRSKQEEVKLAKIKREKTNIEKYGYKTPLLNEEVKEKTKKTLLDKYGVDNVAKNEDVYKKIKQTNLEKYGFESPTQNEDIKAKTKETNLKRYGVEYPMQNDEIREKSKNTCLDKYGCEYVSQNEDIKEKIKQTNMEKYGCENVFQNEEIKEKIKQTNIEKYGCEHPAQNEDIKEKMRQTKEHNGSFNTSKPEDNFYQYLLSIYPKENILRQYQDVCYPFACDFYIKSLDLFIELNLHWTHGGKWFNKQDADCLQKRDYWLSKSQTSEFYLNAITTWAERDLKKRQAALDNNLNYLVFWDEKDIQKFIDNNEIGKLKDIKGFIEYRS